MIIENHLEQLALTWFQDTGWDYRAGPDIAPDSDTPQRSDYRQVLLQGELREALERLNPQIPAAVRDDVAHQLAKPDHPSLIQSNRAFHEARWAAFRWRWRLMASAGVTASCWWTLRTRSATVFWW